MQDTDFDVKTTFRTTPFSYTAVTFGIYDKC